jgi:DNA uptake protein ComE-like DNA-binding protein
MLMLSFSALAESLLDANSASADEMAALPHMDADLAGAVISNRPYATIGALHELLGADLDDDQLTELYAHLFVPVNLNTADESHIMLIPGVGKRMAHEFEEYRPYASLEEFRREIGKYVDEQEVSRLEQYVTLD